MEGKAHSPFIDISLYNPLTVLDMSLRPIEGTRYKS